MKALLEQLLAAAVRKLVGTLVPEAPDVSLLVVERARDGVRGDFTSNIAMRLAKASGRNAHELAQAIVAALPESPLVAKAEVADAGFINFFLARDAFAQEIRRVHELGDAYGRSSIGAGARVAVELVLVKGTEPLNAGHGRLAAYGASLAKVFGLTGYDVQLDSHLRARQTGDEKDRIVVRAEGGKTITLFGGSVRVGERAGSLLTHRQLRRMIGNDACRFFYLARRHDQNLDLDVTLATSRSHENPLYRVQYAHARTASVMKELRARDISFDLSAGLSNVAMLDKQTEQALISALVRLPEQVEVAAANCAPHSIVYYLRDVANAFHTYYNAEKWIVEEADLRNARLALVFAARQVIRNGLALLGVSAPESM